jgi:hypothetical protein
VQHYLSIDQWLGADPEPVRAFVRQLVARLRVWRDGADREEFIEAVVAARRRIAGVWQPPPAPLNELRNAQAIVAASFNFGPRRDPAIGPYDAFNRQLAAYGVPPEHGLPEQYHPHYHHPGGSNEDIADLIEGLYRSLGPKDIWGQIEVIEALRLRHGRAIPDERAAIPAAAYLSTTDAIQQLVTRGLAEYDAIIAVGHPDHVRRIAAGVDVVVNADRAARGLAPARVIVPDVSRVRYHADGVQEWARDDRYREHECAARVKAIYGGLMRLTHLA